MTRLRRKPRAIANELLRGYVRHRPLGLNQRLSALRSVIDRSKPELFATDDLSRYEAQVFSQNGEDGVLIELLNRVGAVEHFFVEFGVQTGHEGNCVLLADVYGWRGLFLEADPDQFDVLQRKYATTAVTTARAMVRPANVEQLFAASNVPAEFDVLSVDIDGNDFWVWQAIRRYRPRVVIIEYNADLDPDDPIVQPLSDAGWDGSGGFGSSLAALRRLAEEKDYRLVHTDLAGVNAFFVRSDLVTWDTRAVPARTANYGLFGGRHRPNIPIGGWQRPF